MNEQYEIGTIKSYYGDVLRIIDLVPLNSSAEAIIATSYTS